MHRKIFRLITEGAEKTKSINSEYLLAFTNFDICFPIRVSQPHAIIDTVRGYAYRYIFFTMTVRSRKMHMREPKTPLHWVMKTEQNKSSSISRRNLHLNDAPRHFGSEIAFSLNQV